MDGVCEGFGGADEYAYFLGAGYAGVYEVALEHYKVLHRHGHDHHRELRALALVDGYGVCESQFVKFRHVIFNDSSVIYNGKGALRRIDGTDKSDVAVKHVLVVVVAYLHNLVTLTECVAATSQ